MKIIVLFLSVSLSSIILLVDCSDHEHVQMLKNFVADHPHLHELVDKTQAGDLEAKHKFERESLSARFNVTKSRLPDNTDAEHVVLHFLDDYTSLIMGHSNHKFMDLEPLLHMLKREDKLREKLVELGESLQAVACDFSKLDKYVTEIMNESIDKMPAHLEL